MDRKPLIHAIYRTTGHENRSSRPSFYTKEACALSFRRALEEAPDVTLTVINDGALSPALRILEPVAASVVRQEGKGNAGSYLSALDFAIEQTSEWVYFVEDDYLHTRDALQCLSRAVAGLPETVGYATLYDHPNNYYQGQGGPITGPVYVYTVGSDYWRSCPSTCMTFCARLSALRQDLGIHRRACSGDEPDDFGLWMAIQGAGLPLRLGQRIPPRIRPHLYRIALRYLQGTLRLQSLRQAHRRLVTSIPSRSTHMMTDLLAPGVDWEKVASGRDKPDSLSSEPVISE